MTVTRISHDALEAFSKAALAASGADAESANAATRAMLHGSLHGVDSHGIRLLPHYRRALLGGRVKGCPVPDFRRTRSGSGLLDLDHGLGARGGYLAADHAVELAREAGIGAVGIRNSSHFGPAGAYSLAIAQAGLVGFVVCNSDAFVRLHDGAERFHGTNPISMAAPTHGDPWLFDMATSAIPYNRVMLYASLGQALPEGTASDANGENTDDPRAAEMLAPLGHEYGFKGAGLAGIAEVLSAVMTGMRLSPEILPMNGEDFATPREMGAFVIALDPAAFAGADLFLEGMKRYLDALRGSRARDGGTVLAAGDREWMEAARRRSEGIPVDADTVAAFARITEETGVPSPV